MSPSRQTHPLLRCDAIIGLQDPRHRLRGTQGTRAARSGSRAAYAIGIIETLPVAERSARAELVRRPTKSTNRTSQHRDQPIDRDHQNVLLKPLDATRADNAQHRYRAASTPAPTPTRQPCRLVAHPREVAIVEAHRLGLDGERDSGRRDCQGVDVPPASPRQRVPQPPPLPLQLREPAPHLVLRASTHAAAPRKRQALAGIEAHPERERQQETGRRDRAFATVTASSTVAPLAIAAVAARDSRRYCWRRGKLNPPVRLIGAAGDQPCGDVPTAPGRTDDPPATSEQPDSINPVSGAAALNPAETSANQHNLDRGRPGVFPGDFQDFRVIFGPVRYRFTRERSVVRNHPCPCRKALVIRGFSRVMRECEVILGGLMLRLGPHSWGPPAASAVPRVRFSALPERTTPCT
jgi:hypothetical protein